MELDGLSFLDFPGSGSKVPGAQGALRLETFGPQTLKKHLPRKTMCL